MEDVKKGDVPGDLNGGDSVVGEPGGGTQFSEKAKPEDAGGEDARFDFVKFNVGIDEILDGKFETGGELLNKLGGHLYDAVRLCPQIAQEIRLEFVENTAQRLSRLERSRRPDIAGYDSASRRDFAHRAVGIAFDMFAMDSVSAPGAKVDEIAGDTRSSAEGAISGGKGTEGDVGFDAGDNVVG